MFVDASVLVAILTIVSRRMLECSSRRALDGAERGLFTSPIARSFETVIVSRVAKCTGVRGDASVEVRRRSSTARELHAATIDARLAGDARADAYARYGKGRAIPLASISATASPTRWRSSMACRCSTRATISPRPISPERGRMNLSPQQDAALLAVSRWLKSPRPQVFRLFGYAGTGKTTLARQIADDVDGEVLFAAFTGKAAQVMRNKGCANARTIHSLIYRPRGEKAEKETGELQPAFALNRTSAVAQGEARRHRRMLDGRREARPRPPLLRHARCWCSAIPASCRR